MLDGDVSKGFYEARRNGVLPSSKVALVIDSNGGLAEDAFEIAKVLQRHCGGFVAVVPRHAKSAATLLAMGADEILMGPFAELGPLDVQVFDPDREEWISGLDEVQALERLHAFVLSSLDQTMFSLLPRTKRKVGAILPHATRLVTQMARPLFENVDVFRYTQMSRLLKVGEEYAKRLLSKNYDKSKADEIASRFVENYPVHSFVIDVDEVRSLGLKIKPATPEMLSALDHVAQHVGEVSAVGPLIEWESGK